MRRLLLLLLLLLLLAGCIEAAEWVRPQASAEANAADHAACREATDRRLRAEFAPERSLSGADVPSGPGQNPVPAFPSRGSIASGGRDDVLLRQDLATARSAADWRRDRLMRDCLEAAGFRREPK
jgi:hypothetical protein